MKQELITHEEFEKISEGPIEERVYADPAPYSETAQDCRSLTDLASSGNGLSRISVPREVKRLRVVNAFHDAFELIGGVPRLAHWGDQHPTEFFKLFARILPSEASRAFTLGSSESDDKVVIQHVLPPTALDR
jgi:hypothetical protein